MASAVVGAQEANARGNAIHHPRCSDLSRPCLAALGVVFGDIATSPLYAIRECFQGHYGIGVTPGNVLAVQVEL